MGDGLPMAAIIISLGDLVAGWWWLMAIGSGGCDPGQALAVHARDRAWLDVHALTAPLAGPLIRKFGLARAR